MKDSLDNPVWNSLCQTHQQFAVAHGGIKFYASVYCPFGGFVTTADAASGISEYAKRIPRFVIGNRTFTSNIVLNREFVCHQMLMRKSVDVTITSEIHELRSASQQPQLFHLVNLVQPGCFMSDTVALGKYYGIYEGNVLIAAAGERMKMDRFTEISAVVTHPDHTGKGYASQLIKHSTDAVFAESKIPYLHVLDTNTGAVRLYKKLGFATRRKISF